MLFDTFSLTKVELSYIVKILIHKIMKSNHVNTTS